MAALGGGYFSVRPLLDATVNPALSPTCWETIATGYFPAISSAQNDRRKGSEKLSPVGVDKWKTRWRERTSALGCYFIRDAEKTECRAKMKGQTLQCLVNVCQFFSHVICGYGPLANASKCSASDIHSCLRQTLLKGKVFFFVFFFFEGGRGRSDARASDRQR